MDSMTPADVQKLAEDVKYIFADKEIDIDCVHEELNLMLATIQSLLTVIEKQHEALNNLYGHPQVYTYVLRGTGALDALALSEPLKQLKE